MASSSKAKATPLKQTSLPAALDKGRKRTITLVDGDQLDLSMPRGIPVTAQVLEAMRLRIIELEDQLAGEQPPTKRARTTAAEQPAPSASTSAAPAPTAASIKAEEKKRKMQIKKVFDRLKKECKADGVKFQGSAKSIKFDEVWEPAEFEALFNGKGTLIQPTPQNKPKSVVTIIQFSREQVHDFFGEEMKAIKGQMWSRGGIAFSKSYKLGACDVSVRSLDVNYSKNNLKCTLKFEVAQTGDYTGGGYGWSLDM